MTSTAGEQSPRLFGDDDLQELLVPVTGDHASERGAAIAARYGELWHVPLKLIHVKTGDQPSDHLGVDSALIAVRSAHPGVPVEGVEVEAESVVSGISDAATYRSLVMLASDHGSQWLERGSVAEAMIQNADDLLVLCGPHCLDPPIGSSVVVPLDGSTRAEAALGPAIAIAEQTRSKLWITTVVPASTVATVASLRARGERVSESGYLRSLADVLSAADVDVGWEIVHEEDPVEGIVAFVRDQGSSIVVAATHGDTGIAKRLFGSVCLGLVEQGPVPIVVVKADERGRVPLLAPS